MTEMVGFGQTDYLNSMICDGPAGRATWFWPPSCWIVQDPDGLDDPILSLDDGRRGPVSSAGL